MFESSEKNNQQEQLNQHRESLIYFIGELNECFKTICIYKDNFLDIYSEPIGVLIERTNEIKSKLEKILAHLNNFSMQFENGNNNNNESPPVKNEKINECLQILDDILTMRRGDAYLTKGKFCHAVCAQPLMEIFSSAKNAIETLYYENLRQYVSENSLQLDSLADEIIFDQVMPLLNGSDLRNLGIACKKFNTLTSDNSFWNKKITSRAIFCEKLAKAFPNLEIDTREAYSVYMNFDLGQFLKSTDMHIDLINSILEEYDKVKPTHSMNEIAEHFDIKEIQKMLIAEIKKYIYEDRLDKNGQLQKKYHYMNGARRLSLNDATHMHIHADDVNDIGYFFNYRYESERMHIYFNALNFIRKCTGFSLTAALTMSLNEFIYQAKDLKSESLVARLQTCHEKTRQLGSLPYQYSVVTSDTFLKDGLILLIKAISSPKTAHVRAIRKKIEDCFHTFFRKFAAEQKQVFESTNLFDHILSRPMMTRLSNTQHDEVVITSTTNNTTFDHRANKTINLIKKLSNLYRINYYDDADIKNDLNCAENYIMPLDKLIILPKIYGNYNHKEKLEVIRKYCPNQYDEIMQLIENAFPNEYFSFIISMCKSATFSQQSGAGNNNNNNTM